MTEILFLAFLAALFNSDVTPFGQFMISRPIVCGPVFGYLLGDIKAGLWIGMIVEMLWISAIPMGAAVPQDAASIAILATVWGLRAVPGQKSALIIALALAVPAGYLFKYLDMRLRFFNTRIAHWVEKGVAQGYESRISQGIYSGLFLFIMKAFVFYAVLFYPGQIIVAAVFPHLNERAVAGLETAWRMLPLVGMGLLMANFREGRFTLGR